MTIHEAIQQRHSVRRYVDRPIEAEKVAALRALMEQCNRESGLNMQLVTDEPTAFNCRMARYGRFSGVSNYFALIGRADEPNLDESIGYYGEKLVLEAQMLGLNTCWVALTYKKKPEFLQMGDGERLRCVISVGYGTSQGVSHKIKSVEKVSKVDGAMPDWFRRGVEAALLAPTAINQQKFTFSLTNGNQVRAKAGWGYFSKVDLGIVKLHFEIGAGTNHFEWINV